MSARDFKLPFVTAKHIHTIIFVYDTTLQYISWKPSSFRLYNSKNTIKICPNTGIPSQIYDLLCKVYAQDLLIYKNLRACLALTQSLKTTICKYMCIRHPQSTQTIPTKVSSIGNTRKTS